MFYLFIPIFYYLCMKFYRMKPISRYSQKASGMHASIKQNYTLLMLEEDRILKIDIENEMKSALHRLFDVGNRITRTS